MATSGGAHRGAHVVDARTGRPPSGIASVTVVAASLTDADIDMVSGATVTSEGYLESLQAALDEAGL